jgi:hypothetical protein
VLRTGYPLAREVRYRIFANKVLRLSLVMSFLYGTLFYTAIFYTAIFYTAIFYIPLFLQAVFLERPF